MLAALGVEVLVAFADDGIHVLMADAAGAVEEGLVVGGEHAIDAAAPEFEGQFFLLLDAEFGLFKKDDDQAVEGIDFVFVEVVLGDDDVLFADTGAAPGSEGHVGSIGIGSIHDQLGGGLSRGGEEELVLDLGEEDGGFLFLPPVVAAEGEEVADFLVEAFLRGPDFANAGEEFVEVVPAAGVLEAFVVHDEAFDDKFGQTGCRPLAELSSALGTNAVADGQNGFEPVVAQTSGDLAFAFFSNL